MLNCSLDTSNPMSNESVMFPRLLSVGDRVAIWEGHDENTLSIVVAVSSKYIHAEAYPNLRFDRETGK